MVYASQYHYEQLNIHVYLTAVSNLLFVHSGVLSLLLHVFSSRLFVYTSYLGSTADR